jgi:hypothetical protein
VLSVIGIRSTSSGASSQPKKPITSTYRLLGRPQPDGPGGSRNGSCSAAARSLGVLMTRLPSTDYQKLHSEAKQAFC